MLMQILILLVYCIMPSTIKTVMLLGDVLLEDSIKMIDEIIMLIIYFSSTTRALRAVCFVQKHKVLTLILLILMTMVFRRNMAGA